MSGFVGLVNAVGLPVDPVLLRALTRSLEMRGPGNLAVHTEGVAGFGMAQGRQIPRLEEHTCIVSDARLDGRQELIARFDPPERGPLSDVSDGELILHCYRRWHEDALLWLTGDFSFALWDATRRRLLCARDPLGVKPFFYARTAGGLAVSNTLQCLRAHSDVPASLNDLALADFLLFGAMKDPSATAFSAIERLPPGHSLVYEKGNVRVRRYWRPDWGQPLRYRRAGEVVEHFREVLAQAVADRATSSHTGILMSGGLDSTAVAAAARATPTSVKAFTVVYDHLIPDEERHFSGVAADFLRVPIEYLVADDYRLFAEPPGAMPSPEPVDEPLASVFLDHLRQVSNFSSVALSGQGGDAIFAIPAGLGVQMLRSGHPRELLRGAWQFLYLRRSVPPLGFRGSLKRVLSGPMQPTLTEYPDWLNPDLETRFNLRERWRLDQQQQEPSSAPGVLLNRFWPALFEGYDPGFTGIPLEIRHPLLDLRLIRLCMSLFPAPWWVDKTLLRVAMRDRLPSAICFRRKAPVAIDPVTARLERDGLQRGRWIERWEPNVRLNDFVEWKKLSLLANDTDFAPWGFRPFVLNRWLASISGGFA